ncbi:MAG: hypothetical protein ACXW3Q_14645 [Rhodoplanes sp.]
MFDGDAQRRQLAARGGDDDLEGRGLADELFGLRDFDRGSGHAPGVEEDAAGGEQQDRDEREENPHLSMIAEYARILTLSEVVGSIDGSCRLRIGRRARAGIV